MPPRWPSIPKSSGSPSLSEWESPEVKQPPSHWTRQSMAPTGVSLLKFLYRLCLARKHYPPYYRFLTLPTRLLLTMTREVRLADISNFSERWRSRWITSNDTLSPSHSCLVTDMYRYSNTHSTSFESTVTSPRKSSYRSHLAKDLTVSGQIASQAS